MAVSLSESIFSREFAFRYPEFLYPEEPAGRLKERLVSDECAVEKKLVATKQQSLDRATAEPISQ